MKLIEIYREITEAKSKLKEEDTNAFYVFLGFCCHIIALLEENHGIIHMKVEDERTGKEGFIGFGFLMEEVYREIPRSDKWGYNYLKALFDSPGFRLVAGNELLPSTIA